jgi:glycosyltransferase involved in cell wall biosynthesis
MPKISAVIITLNEEKNIERCIKSLEGVADEILIVDSFSTDRTEEICERYGVTFVQHKFEGYIEQKNWAASQAANNYVLSLDADEALSDELRESILQVKDDWQYDGYYFNRLTNYCGKWIKHTSWYPSRKLRLWDRRKGRWTGLNPHDKFLMVKGSSIKNLHGDLLHYSYYTISEQIQQINKFTDILSVAYYQQGFNANYRHIIFHPLWRFFRDYFIKLGFLDGFYGFVVSLNASFEVYLKYLKLKNKIENEREKELYRTCFIASNRFSYENEWIVYNATKLIHRGYDSTVISQLDSDLLIQKKDVHLNYFDISIGKWTFFNIIKIIKLIRYFKRLRINTVIVSNPGDLKIIAITSHFAGVKNILFYQSSNDKINDSIINQYLFKRVQNILINSKRDMYTIIMRNYKLITKEKIRILEESNNYEISEELLGLNPR